MFLPLSASNDRIRLPKATLTLIGINFLIYFLSSRLEGLGLGAFYYFFGLVPAYVLSPDFIIWYKTFPFLTSMFVHGSFLHLAGNCLFLYVFGSELENRFGRRKYLYFYLLSGIYAGLFYVTCEWQSPMPAIGASGAISGLMGAVLFLFPTAGIRIFFVSFFPVYARIIEVPAYICIGLWFLMQLALGLSGLETGIAYWDHVGGVVGGFALSVLVLTRPFARPRKAKKKNLLVLGKSRPAPRAPRHEVILDHARAIAVGIMRSRTFFRVTVALLVFYVILLYNFYRFNVSVAVAFWLAVINSLLFIVPFVYFLFLNKAVHGGLSSFFGAYFSLLYEGRQDHEVRPDIYRAGALERKGDYLGAIREYRGLFAQFPNRIDILYRIAEIYRKKLKDTKKAIGSYKALLNYPEDGEYSYCVRHARELIETLEAGTPEHPEPIGIDGVETEDDFIVGRF